MRKHSPVNYLLLVLISMLIVLQAWIAYDWKSSTRQIRRELQSLSSTDAVTMTKLREEAYKLKLENEKNALFWYSLFANFGTVIGVMVALSGGWVAINQYFSNKRKDRLDRTQDSINTLLGEINERDDPVAQVSALILYMEEEYGDFHKRVALALSFVGSKGNKSRPLEQAFVNAFESGIQKMPGVMRAVSWQGLCLSSVPLNISKWATGADLSGFDFRNIRLEQQDGDRHRFNGCSLRKADFAGSSLVGVDFNDCDLGEASFHNAALRDVSFTGANLTATNLIGARVSFVDVKGANFREIKLARHSINWNLIRHKAYAENLGDDLEAYFAEHHFVRTSGKKILMLINEYPPNTFGGLWTSVYHHVKILSRMGADITLMVPASSSDLDLEIFGADITVIPIREQILTSYDGRVVRRPQHDPSSFNPYNYSTYSSVPKLDFEKYTMAAYEKIIAGSIAFDLIHAHDWVTFLTASFLSREFGRPWIAHIHSIEVDRNIHPNSVIAKVEREACENAALVIVPSSYTSKRVSDAYHINPQKITVHPNLISSRKKKVVEYGSFASKRVVFAGRIAWQKGVDVFVDICNRLNTQVGANFQIYGKSEGDDYARSVLNHLPGHIRYQYSKDWSERESIFENASVVIVPSRSEPFGMVILEAMECGVPVLFPASAGVGEFIDSALKLNDAALVEEAVAKALRLLKDEDYWNAAVRAQNERLDAFIADHNGAAIVDRWNSLV